MHLRRRHHDEPDDDDVQIDPETGRYPPNPGEDGGRLDFPGNGWVPPILSPADRPVR